MDEEVRGAAHELEPLTRGDEFDAAPQPPQQASYVWTMVKVGAIAAALVFAVGACWPAQAASTSGSTVKGGKAVFTAEKAFPTSEFPSMYYMPKSQEGEPQPVITRVGGGKYAASLNDPKKLPSVPPSSEGVLPKASQGAPGGHLSDDQFQQLAVRNVSNIINKNSTSKCDRCLQALQLGQHAARAKPELVPEVLVKLCKKYKYKDSPSVDVACEGEYRTSVWGGPYTQVLSYANMSSKALDGQYICAKMLDACPYPEEEKLSHEFLQHWFHGQVEEPAKVTQRSKKVGPKQKNMLRVLHTSDIHVDARYSVGAEANCTSGQCCRTDSFNKKLWSKTQFAPDSLPRKNISQPANYWGMYKCDSPWSLVAAAMEGVSYVAGKAGFDWAIYTGDLATHDADWHISRDLVTYSEQALYDILHRHLRNTTMVVALGNHDSSPADLAAPSSLPDGRGDQLSWDWDNVAKVLRAENWIDDSTMNTVRKHYGGYSVRPRKGLRVIALNSDFWYGSNPMVFLHLRDPDYSGTLRFLTNELQAAEDAHERAWVIAHVETGWAGKDAVDSPTNLLNHIATRYKSTIAHFFFGHTHEDMFQVFYSSSNGNASTVSRKTQDAVANAYIGPSITPLSNVNPSLRVYEVDPETYEVHDYQQYYTQLYNFPNVSKTDHGPIWKHLYSARETYSNFSASASAGTYKAPVKLQDNHTWPSSAPLNASFWAAVTDEMEKRPELITLHQIYQGRNSPMSPPCDNDKCYKAKVCYMRSSTSALGRQCPSHYKSVQG